MARGASYVADKDNLLLRLRKMEGQVRGLQQMIADERYCLDIIQQINALTAAAREVEIVLGAAQGQGDEATIREMTTILRRALRP